MAPPADGGARRALDRAERAFGVDRQGLAGALEIIGGLLIIVGLFTRLTAFVLAGFLAAAYFMGHAPNSFFPLINNGDAAILFCFIFLYFSAAGAGPWSLDAKRE